MTPSIGDRAPRAPGLSALDALLRRAATGADPEVRRWLAALAASGERAGSAPTHLPAK
jgi:hypothetical protein